MVNFELLKLLAPLLLAVALLRPGLVVADSVLRPPPACTGACAVPTGGLAAITEPYCTLANESNQLLLPGDLSLADTCARLFDVEVGNDLKPDAARPHEAISAEPAAPPPVLPPTPAPPAPSSTSNYSTPRPPTAASPGAAAAPPSPCPATNTDTNSNDETPPWSVPAPPAGAPPSEATQLQGADNNETTTTNTSSRRGLPMEGGGRWDRLRRSLSERAVRSGRHVAAGLAVGRSAVQRNPKTALWGVCLTLLAILLLQRARRPTYDLDRIPGPWTHALPLLGNILQVLRPDFHRVCLHWADKYGGIVRVKFLWHDGVMVTDPAALASVCGRGEHAVDKAAALYMPINEMCTPHAHPNLLTSAADDAWRAVRKAVALSFAFGNIRKKFAVIRERTGELVEWLRRLGPEQSVDVDQAALRVTLDVIGLTAFGHDYGCTRLQEVPYNHLLRVLPRAFTEVMRRIANPFRKLAPGAFKNGSKGRLSFLDFQTHMKALLREIKERGPPARGDTDIAAQLYRVMEAARQEADKINQAKRWPWRWLGRRAVPAITDERILSEIGILFVEGFETTGHTISWTLFNIATTPGVQEAVAEELGARGLLVRSQAQGGRAAARALVLEDLKRLRYLTACVKEAMRMYPVVSIMGRCTEKPTRVGPYLVPAGTPVATPLFAIHNTVHNWRDPMEFKPERWNDVPLESYVLDLRIKEGILTPNGTNGIANGTATHSKVNGIAANGNASGHHMAFAAAPAGPRQSAESWQSDRPAVAADMRSHPLSHHIAASPRTVSPEPLATMSSGASYPGSSMPASSDDGDESDTEHLGGPAGRRTGISFMPFSEGPRSCVGQSLAKLEVMTVLATLLANFRIELAPEMGGREGVRKLESTHLTLQTRGTRGIRMHLHPRELEP